MKNIGLSLSVAVLVAACTNGDDAQANGNTSAEKQAMSDISPVDRKPFHATEIAGFDEPWAMTFLPDGRMLVSEKAGKLQLVDAKGQKTEIGGVPEVDYGGQGGFGDIVLAPDFATSNMVYLSWVEAGDKDTRGAVVGRARLELKGQKPALKNLQTIWKQNPKVEGRGHFSHRIAFSPDGEYLFIGSISARSSGYIRMARFRRTILLSTRTARFRKSGRSATAIFSGLPLIAKGVCGIRKWARKRVTN